MFHLPHGELSDCSSNTALPFLSIFLLSLTQGLAWLSIATDLERNGRECILKRKTRSLHEIWKQGGSWGPEKGRRPRVLSPSGFIELLCIAIDHEAYVV
jgi:hypothetical protein